MDKHFSYEIWTGYLLRNCLAVSSEVTHDLKSTLSKDVTPTKSLS